MAFLHVDPGAWALCAAGAAAYAVGVRRLRARRIPWPAWRSAALVGAVLTILVATTSPLDLDAATRPSLQAVSQCLLLLVAPLLLAWAAPQTLAVEAGRAPAVRRLRAAISSRPLRLLFAPPVAISVFCASLCVVDLTPLRGAAAHHGAVGEAVQLLLLVAGAVYMAPVFGADPLPRRLANVASLVYLLLLLPFFTLFGMAVESTGTAQTISRSGPAGAADAFGSSLTSAGDILWTVGGLLSIVLTILVLVRWLRVEERATPNRDTGLDELAHAQLTAWREARQEVADAEAERRIEEELRRTAHRGASTRRRSPAGR